MDIYSIGDQIIVTKKFYFKFHFKTQKSVLCKNEIDFFYHHILLDKKIMRDD